jgi:hypothetical protein
MQVTIGNPDLTPEAYAKVYNLLLPKPEQTCISTQLQQIAEDWSGVELQQTLTFGIRAYTEGAGRDRKK